MITSNTERKPVVPRFKDHHKVLDVYFDRSGHEVYNVEDMSRAEALDLVCFMLSKGEIAREKVEEAMEAMNDATFMGSL